MSSAQLSSDLLGAGRRRRRAGRVYLTLARLVVATVPPRKLSLAAFHPLPARGGTIAGRSPLSRAARPHPIPGANPAGSTTCPGRLADGYLRASVHPLRVLRAALLSATRVYYLKPFHSAVGDRPSLTVCSFSGYTFTASSLPPPEPPSPFANLDHSPTQ